MPTDATSDVSLFISHSKRDVALARRLIQLLEACFELPARSIRCSSLAGYDLHAGDAIATTLRDDIRRCQVVIGLLTKASIKSHWVLMELGAAWALEKPTLPLLGPGVVLRDVPGPFRELKVLKLNYAGDMRSLIETLAVRAAYKPRSDDAAVARARDSLMRHLRTRMRPGKSAPVNSWPALPDPADVVRTGAEIATGVSRLGTDVVRGAVDAGAGVVSAGNDLIQFGANQLRAWFP